MRTFHAKGSAEKGRLAGAFLQRKHTEYEAQCLDRGEDSEWSGLLVSDIGHSEIGVRKQMPAAVRSRNGVAVGWCFEPRLPRSLRHLNESTKSNVYVVDQDVQYYAMFLPALLAELRVLRSYPAVLKSLDREARA